MLIKYFYKEEPYETIYFDISFIDAASVGRL